MSKRMLRKVSGFITENERREFAGMLAQKKYEGWNDISSTMLKVGYAKGVEDAMLTPEDIGTIFNLVRERQKKYTATEACYPEVLEAFNEIKFKK